MKADDLHIQKGASSVFQNHRERSSHRNSPDVRQRNSMLNKSLKNTEDSTPVFDRNEKRQSGVIAQLLLSESKLPDFRSSQRILSPEDSQTNSKEFGLQTGQSISFPDKPITENSSSINNFVPHVVRPKAIPSQENVTLLNSHFSKLSKLTSNSFMNKYKEKITEMTQTDKRLENILECSLAGDNHSLDSFPTNSNVDMENVRSLNLFFENRQVPSHEFFKSYIKHIVYETPEPEENEDSQTSDINFIDITDEQRAPEQSKKSLWSEQGSLPHDIVSKLENFINNPVSFRSESDNHHAFANSFRMSNDWLLSCKQGDDSTIRSNTDCEAPLILHQSSGMYFNPPNLHGSKLDLPPVGENIKEDDSQSQMSNSTHYSKQDGADIEILDCKSSRSNLSELQRSNKLRSSRMGSDTGLTKKEDQFLPDYYQSSTSNIPAFRKHKAKIKDHRFIPSLNEP